MTVEEIDIIVNASVEKALSEFNKLVPGIQKTIKQVTEKINSTDFGNLKTKAQQATNFVKAKMSNLTKSNKDNEVSIKINNKDAEKQISQIEKQINSLQEKINARQMKLDIINPQIDKIMNDTRKNVTPDGINPNSKTMDTTVNHALGTNKEFVTLNNQAQKLYTEIEMYNKQLSQAKANMAQLGQQTSQTATTQNKLSSFFSAFKSKLGEVITHSKGLKNTFSQMPKITQKITNNIKGMAGRIKGSLGHVLKYAGALFSLRGIYNVLSSSAQSWLSSQNKGAQQLSANIEYMKYAMGSVFAPVIEYVINLVYQLMKAIQSVVYSFSGINIFAKATASSMGKTANSAKQASKSLAGVHNEINNISEKDNSGGSGSTTPSMDLSKIENTPHTILEAIKNGNWYEVGATIGQKLNETMASIPWDKIQDTARKIGRGIAKLLNGFIATTDWKQVGNTFAQGVNTIIYTGYEFVTTFDWKQFGKAIGDTVSGFFKNIDWATVGKTISNGIKGVFDTISGFFQTFDWSVIVKGLFDFIGNFDWNGVSDAIFKALGSACASLVKLGMVLGEYLVEALSNMGQYFKGKIEECGGNIVAGIQKGILDALINIGKWVIDHIFTPFIEGFKEAFGIHSPSKVMEEQGRYIIDGLFNGLLGIWDKVSSIFTSLGEKISEKFTEIKTNLGNWAENTKETIRGWADDAKTKISECWANVSTTVGEKIETVKNNISTGLENAKSTISTWANNIKTTWGEHWNNMANEVGNGLDTAKSDIDIWTSGVEASLSGLGTNATTWGSDLALNMASGIRKNINTVANAAKAVANNISSYLHFSEPDVGPLSNFHTYMPDMIDLMTQGIHSNRGKLTNELETMTEMMSYKINTPNIAPLSLETRNNNPIQPRNVMTDTLGDLLSDNENNVNITIPLTVQVGSKKIAEILLENLRDMKRQTGKDIEALVG